MTIDHLFDTTCENAHLVKVDAFEAHMPTVEERNAAHAKFHKHNDFPVKKATEKQLSYLKDLFSKRTGNEEAMIIRQHLLDEYAAGNLSVRMASEAIDDIKNIPVDAQPLPSTFGAVLPQTNAVEHGQIWMDSEGQYVKVCLNQAGTAHYGKVWDMHHQEWVFTQGCLWGIDHLVTAEEAHAWSRQWDAEQRYCVFCSKHLSDPRSEYAGYGETCAGNRGLPWGDVASSEDEELIEPAYPAYASTRQQIYETDLIKAPSTEDVVEYPYGTGTCRICNQPRPFVLNGFLRGCNC